MSDTTGRRHSSPAGEERSGTTPTAWGASDQHFIGAQVAFGSIRLGQVQGVLRDPLSHRVRYVVMRYGTGGRRVAVPMEWVVRSTPGGLVLGVGTRSLDDLPDQADVRHGGALTTVGA